MRHPAEEAATVLRGRGVLLVRSGPEAGRRLLLPDRPCRIGRGGESRILVADPDDPPALSREHATLAPRDRDLAVTDHSTNGTCLAGTRRLARGESGVLRPGEELRLGPSLVLRWEPAAAPERPPAPSRAGAPPPPRDLRAALADREVLRAAWRRVELNRGDPGPDNVTVDEFRRDAGRRLGHLRHLLLQGRYEPLPPRLYAAPKRAGGVRTIAILTVQDRIVQHALHSVLQPLLDPLFPPCSFAYRPGVCTHHALRRLDALLAEGRTWVAETDIAGFFDHVRHHALLEMLAAHVPDPFVLSLAARCLAAGAAGPGAGLPQGAATSPLLSNLYLAGFDRHLLESGRSPVRYGDDLVIACESRGAAQAALAEAEGYLRSRLDLSLKAEKTGVVSLAQGFTFLGFRFTPGGRRAAPAAVAQLRERLAEAEPERAPAVLKGWEGYFGPAGSGASGPPPGEEEARRFLELFAGREETHARQSWSGGRLRFTPCSGPLDASCLRAHLSGEETFALYLQRVDGRVRLLVLDLDQPRGSADPAPPRAHAEALWAACRRYGVPALLEESGGKGFHLWVPFAAPVPPESARKLGRLLLAAAGCPHAGVPPGVPREGVRVEVFPRHTEWPGPELGDAVKLPLGVHPATGRRSFFLDEDGEPASDPAGLLARVRPLDPETLPGLLRSLARPAGGPVPGAGSRGRPRPPGTPPAEALTARCSVLRALEARALETGHLRHTHNLILLYTAGRLGEAGAAYLHRVIGMTRNYAPEVCQGYLDRLDPSRRPLSCARIREWLEEEGEQGLCTCPRERRTPLDGLVSIDPPGSPPAAAAAGERRTRGRPGGPPASGPPASGPPASGPPASGPPASGHPAVSEEDRRLWEVVAGDLFGRAAPAPGPEPAGEKEDAR